MERTRNWQGWAALILAGAALAVALSGRFWPGSIAVAPAAPAAAVTIPAAPAAPAAPRMFEDGRFGPGRGEPPAFMREQLEREMGRGPGFERGFGPGRPDMGHGFNHGFGHRFGPLGFLFGLMRGIGQLVAFGLLAWLLLRMFRQRNAAPATAAAPTPTTPAGHDPRVE